MHDFVNLISGNTSVMPTVNGRAAFDNMASVRRPEDLYQTGESYDMEGSITPDPIELFVIEAGGDEEPMPHQTSLYLRIGAACQYINSACNYCRDFYITQTMILLQSLNSQYTYNYSVYICSLSVFVVFGLGTMIYDALLVKQNLNHADDIPAGCPKSHVWSQYVHLVFMLVQTYFIFKHPQVVILQGVRWSGV